MTFTGDINGVSSALNDGADVNYRVRHLTTHYTVLLD